MADKHLYVLYPVYWVEAKSGMTATHWYHGSHTPGSPGLPFRNFGTVWLCVCFHPHFVLFVNVPGVARLLSVYSLSKTLK